MWAVFWWLLFERSARVFTGRGARTASGLLDSTLTGSVSRMAGDDGSILVSFSIFAQYTHFATCRRSLPRDDPYCFSRRPRNNSPVVTKEFLS